MKSDSGNKNGSRDDSRKSSKTSHSLPQINMDPEKRRDFFNKLLEKYSTKSTKVPNPSYSKNNNASVSQLSSKVFIPFTPKSAPKSKEKNPKKKKIHSDKNIVKVVIADENLQTNIDELWKSGVKYHSYDYNVYKNHNRVRNRYPFPLPCIEEQEEPLESIDESGNGGSNNDECQETIDHSFTLYHSGDQGRRDRKDDLVMCYEERLHSNSLPCELKPRHLTKTLSGSMIWAGNDVVHGLLKPQRKIKAHIGGDEPSDKDMNSVRGKDDSKSFSGIEERQCKTLVKVKKTKSKKTTAVLELDDGSKSHKQTSSAEGKQIVLKPSSSSLPHLALEENSKTGKKSNEKNKKPKKLIKKQTFTLVTTSKPPA